MANLKSFRDEAIELIEKSLGDQLSAEKRDEIVAAIEGAIRKATQHTQESTVDVMLKYPLGDQDKAHKLADEIRRKTEALIANLSSQR
ncbi:hypothetical protein H0I76_02215 [Limibaculum sp. M0105]|uniref:Uncharacterized protein n=1 Tax=Thermohalobaculum xanthum TaxID=2753746 RepID=A0A8J7SCM9_9RHOB|nr:hypothetical protein [Thermohalobaculum xanthum]MBK0397992.1 hypothetical protein [Thermohalobaculum xanthum]